MNRRLLAMIVLGVLVLGTASACVYHVPPGQVKKQSAPGQMKKR